MGWLAGHATNDAIIHKIDMMYRYLRH